MLPKKVDNFPSREEVLAEEEQSSTSIVCDAASMKCCVNIQDFSVGREDGVSLKIQTVRSKVISKR